MYNKPSKAVQISSVPISLSLVVDGVGVVTPVAYNWAPGSIHTVVAPLKSGLYEFVRWTQGGPASQSIAVPAQGATIAATYRVLYPVAAAVGSGLGTVVLTPQSPDDLYPDGTLLTLKAEPQSGYCFSSWSGLTAGTHNETTLLIKKKYSVKAKFIAGSVTIPFLSKSISAAGGTFSLAAAASTGCGWTNKTNVPWITLLKAFATSASPAVTYVVQPNTSGLTRKGIITVDDTTVMISQTG